MQDYHAQQPENKIKFKVGDMVWLDAKNLQQLQPSWKLAHRRLGPYKIKRVLGDLNYELDLPNTMKIHPVFYVGLLYPAPQSTIPGRNFPQPPPIVINDEEAFEVEESLPLAVVRLYYFSSMPKVLKHALVRLLERFSVY